MFKKYRRKQIAELRAELREVEVWECRAFHTAKAELRDNGNIVSISQEDLKAGSPKPGDMVARNPKNHNDVWLVAKAYFEDNFESIE